MSQYDFGTIDPYVVDGVQLASMLNNWRDAVHSWHRGASRPSYIVPGQMWINDAGGATNWIVNVYISPSVGDLPVFTYNTTAGTITVSAAAGGTLAAAILLAQAAASPSVRWNATGNPIDAKAWRATVTATGALRFSQYNDAGTEISYTELPVGGSGTQPMMRMYSEQLLASAAATLTVTIPTGAKLIELVYFTSNAAAADANLQLNEMNGASPVVTANHNAETLWGAGGVTSSQAYLASTTWLFQTGNLFFGTARFTLASTVTLGVNDFYMINAGAGRIVAHQGMDSVNTTVTGFRLQNQTAVNFAAGSYMRCFAA